MDSLVLCRLEGKELGFFWVQRRNERPYLMRSCNYASKYFHFLPFIYPSKTTVFFRCVLSSNNLVNSCLFLFCFSETGIELVEVCSCFVVVMWRVCVFEIMTKIMNFLSKLTVSLHVLNSTNENKTLLTVLFWKTFDKVRNILFLSLICSSFIKIPSQYKLSNKVHRASVVHDN